MSQPHVSSAARPARNVLRRIGVACALMALVALLVVAALCVRFANLQPTIARDYFNEVKSGVAQIPDDQRMMPTIERAHAAWRQYIADHEGFENVFIGDTRPKDEGWAAAVAMMDTQSVLLAELREASKRRGMGVSLVVADAFVSKYPAHPPLMFSSSTPLSAARSAMRLLQQSFLIRLERAEFASAIDDLCAIIRIGQKCVTIGTSLEQLVAFASANKVVELVRAELLPRAQEIPNEELQRVRAALAGFSLVSGKPLRVLVEFDRMSMADVVQRVYTDDGKGDGWLLVTKFEDLFPSLRFGTIAIQARKRPVWGAWQFPMAMWADTRAQTEAKIAKQFAEGEALLDVIPALWPQKDHNMPARQELFDAAFHFESPSMVADVTHPPFLGKMAEIQWTTRQLISSIDVAFALEMYRKRTGTMPATLGALVPRDLAAVPIDIFDGKPIKYIVGPCGVFLYSVGMDGVDDSCSESDSESYGWWDVRTKDIILYPHVAKPESPAGTSESTE